MKGLAHVGADAAGQLADLHARAFERSWSAGDITRLLDNPASFALLATEAGREVGFILAWAPAAEAEILTLAVVPDARRLGVGAKLTAGAMAAALARGAGEMRLEVAEDNVAARALYAKLGFCERGRRPGYYRRSTTGCDALLLSRPLPRSGV